MGRQRSQAPALTQNQQDLRPQAPSTAAALRRETLRGLLCGREGKDLEMVRKWSHRARIPEPPSSQPVHFLPLPLPHPHDSHSHEHPGASARQAQGGTRGNARAPSTRTVRYGLRSPCHQGCLRHDSPTALPWPLRWQENKTCRAHRTRPRAERVRCSRENRKTQHGWATRTWETGEGRHRIPLGTTQRSRHGTG